MKTVMTQAARKLSFEDYTQLGAAAWEQLGLSEGRCGYRAQLTR
jgi:hypothetical protein